MGLFSKKADPIASKARELEEQLAAVQLQIKKLNRKLEKDPEPPAAWRRLVGYFRGPATHNPKLVSYLAAGSIRGLRPLRYEKRVARNRFLLMSGFFVVVLYWLTAVFWRHR